MPDVSPVWLVGISILGVFPEFAAVARVCECARRARELDRERVLIVDLVVVVLVAVRLDENRVEELVELRSEVAIVECEQS